MHMCAVGDEAAERGQRAKWPEGKRIIVVKKTHKVSALFILLNVTDGLLNDFAA